MNEHKTVIMQDFVHFYKVDAICTIDVLLTFDVILTHFYWWFEVHN